MIKTFRGRIADDGQDRIRLSTIKGKMGYRIVKLELIAINGNINVEQVLKIYKISTTPSTDINFTDSDLMAAGILIANTGNAYNPPAIVVFDQEIVNQDIYVTSKGHDTPAEINYYLELEVIPLDDAGAEYTTLKDMRTV